MAGSSSVEPTEFRQVLGRYPTGVTVVTALDEHEPVGMAVGTFTSISLDPPLVGFFPVSTSRTWARIRWAEGFCVNVLGANHQDVCRAFATSDADRFAGVSWTSGPVGAPMLSDAIAWINCRLSSVHTVGDHDLAVGAVEHLHTNNSDSTPLIFHRGRYGTCLLD